MMQLELDFTTMAAESDETIYSFGPWLSVGPADEMPEGLFQHADADGVVWPVGCEWCFLPKSPRPAEATVAYRVATPKPKEISMLDDTNSDPAYWAAPEQQPEDMKEPAHFTFRMGGLVQKKRGSNWRGRICGFYSTSITPQGYAIESAMEPGNVQIYPVDALKPWDGDE